MALPWVRIDSNIALHDKILDLLTRRNGRAIAFSYVCAIGYCGGQGTDGLVPFAALPFIHATRKDAETLVEVGLFVPHAKGWLVRNYDERQQSSMVTDAIRQAQKDGSVKGNCIRWHGPACGCWRDDVGGGRPGSNGATRPTDRSTDRATDSVRRLG